jgi:hypothetical protein
MQRQPPPEMIERTSLCLPNYSTGIVLHNGDDGFFSSSRRIFEKAQNDANERLCVLKARLREANTADFWKLLLVGLTELVDSQMAFVCKRVLVDDQNSAIEMPPIGEPGSCIMGEAFYYNDGRGVTDFHRNYSFQAYGAPCGHMRHDKVLLIPDRLNEFITRNPNTLPFPPEAYMAVPLFAEGKSIGHYGMMWTREGVRRRQLSWAYIEMVMHSLEDMVTERLVSGRSFCLLNRPSSQVDSADKSARPSRVIPHDAVLASQSLKPYARSLSHELRTPMQGVVGMLDVMHATVRETTEAETSPHLRKIFESLKENIEMLQGEWLRAISTRQERWAEQCRRLNWLI